jgi:hypothetical protein
LGDTYPSQSTPEPALLFSAAEFVTMSGSWGLLVSFHWAVSVLFLSYFNNSHVGMEKESLPSVIGLLI